MIYRKESQYNNKSKHANIYSDLVMYKQFLIDSKFAYRINPTEANLSSLNAIQQLHDIELARVHTYLTPKSDQSKATIETDFEIRHTFLS